MRRRFSQLVSVGLVAGAAFAVLGGSPNDPAFADGIDASLHEYVEGQ